MTAAKQAFWCRHRDGYSVISFPAEMSNADMSEIRDAGAKIVEQLSSIKAPACLVDLSALSYMGSSMVASIVKIWKAVNVQGGKMVVVAPGTHISDVLKVTGLTKVWTIVSTFESGVHALGCSVEAKVEKRERRMLWTVGPIAFVAAAVAVVAAVLPDKIPVRVPPWIIYTLCGLSLFPSLISVFRESGWRRLASGIGFVLTLGLTGFSVWYMEIRTTQDAVAEKTSGATSGGKQNSDSSGSAGSSGSAQSDANQVTPPAGSQTTESGTSSASPPSGIQEPPSAAEPKTSSEPNPASESTPQPPDAPAAVSKPELSQTGSQTVEPQTVAPSAAGSAANSPDSDANKSRNDAVELPAPSAANP